MANTEPNVSSDTEAAPVTYPQDAPGIVMTPAHRARRSLLRGAAGAVVVVAAGYFTWTRYLFPPVKPLIGPVGGTILGKTTDFPPGQPHITGRYIVENQGGQFQVLSNVCTHQGCAVGWDAKDPTHFVCPCHGAVYDLAGKNVSGPAPSPLAELASHVSGDTLYVTGCRRIAPTCPFPKTGRRENGQRKKFSHGRDGCPVHASLHPDIDATIEYCYG